MVGTVNYLVMSRPIESKPTSLCRPVLPGQSQSSRVPLLQLDGRLVVLDLLLIRHLLLILYLGWLLLVLYLAVL